MSAKGEELVLYTAPFWVYVGYLLAIAGAGAIMWAGAESKWMIMLGGVALLIVGSAIIWAQKLHRKAWAKKNDLPAE